LRKNGAAENLLRIFFPTGRRCPSLKKHKFFGRCTPLWLIPEKRFALMTP
jgi:hypothetical protein